MVYFMQPVDGGPIKIGYSVDVDRRHSELEGEFNRRLAVLATIEGGRKREAEIHARFAHLRIGKTEQFKPASELMEFIGLPLLVSPNPDAVAVMESTRQDEAVRIRADVAAKARIAASFNGETIMEYVSRILDPIVTRDIDEGYARLSRGGDAPKRSRTKKTEEGS